MEDRRGFIKLTLGSLAGLGLLLCSPVSGLQLIWAKTKRVILPKGTKRGTLSRRNPAEVDARNIEITPLKDFGTMGLTNHEVDLDTWRLEVTGHVDTPLRLSYAQLRDLPSIERNVLQICPGVFANHGAWRGISINNLRYHWGTQRSLSKNGKIPHKRCTFQ
jgi:sulfoxide reductase catalytic subunit YedY